MIRTGSSRFKIQSSIDFHLVIHSINKVGLDGFFKIPKRFETGDLSEPEIIIVEELYFGCWPSYIAFDHNSNSFCIDRCEVDGCEVLT